MNLEIGAKIKQLRLARGMTQEQLGKPLRLSAQPRQVQFGIPGRSCIRARPPGRTGCSG